MPRSMRKYKADILPELQRDEIARLRDRVTALEGHRLQWRRRASEMGNALSDLLGATDDVLKIGPVQDSGIVLPIGTRGALQEARNRAWTVFDHDTWPDEPAEQHKGVERREDNEGKGNG